MKARLLLVLCLGLAACDFSPSTETPFTEVDPTIDPLDIDLTEAPDTLVLYGDVTFRPAVADPRPVGRVEVLLGDRVVASGVGPGPVPFNSRNQPDGFYRFRVRAFAPSGTGSLADRTGRELVIGETERIAILDNAPVQSIEPRLAPEAGRLAVTWEAVERPSFEAYRVVEVDAQGQRTVRATLTNSSATRWVDSLIVGGTARYAIELAITGREASGPTAVRDFGTARVVEAEALEPTRIRVGWTASPFPANVDRYVLERSSAEDDFVEGRITTAASLADTTSTDDVEAPFGARYLYRVLAVSQGPARQTTSPAVEVAVDRTTGRRYRIHTYIETLDAFIATAESRDGERRLVRIDGQTFDVTAELAGDPGTVLASPSGNLLLLGNDLFQNLTDVFRAVDPATFTVTHTVSRSALLGQARPATFDGSAQYTDDGILIARYGEFYSPAFYDALGLIVVDILNDRLLDRIDATGTRPPSFNVNYDSVTLQRVSPDGRFALVDVNSRGTVLYEIGDDGTLTDRGEIANGWFPPYFFIADRELAVGDPFTSGGPVTVYGVPSFDVARQIPMRGFFGGGYDATTDVLYGMSGSEVGLQRLAGSDAQTGATRWEVEIAPNLGFVDYAGGVLFGGGYVRRVMPVEAFASSR